MTGAAQLVAIDPYLDAWLDLVLRWLHVIAAIAWIGSSFYFIALDYELTPPKDARAVEEGVGGEAWEIHGGGFYHVHKYVVAPPRLPERLLWFKWEAYTTWLSGFALMIVVYYLNADVYLIDPTVADLRRGEAIAISVALLAAAWIVYDVLCRLLGKNDLVLATCIFLLAVLAAWGTTELFSARAGYIQTGAMLGTIMAGNVLIVIIPAHSELVRAKEAGREPDPWPGIEAKRRSVHNNYLTLPVLFTMLAGHFSFTYGHSRSWLILVVLMLLGAWIRLFFNLRHQGRTVWAIPALGAIAMAGLAVAIRPGEGGKAASGGQPVPFARVHAIVARRCATCHSARPTSPSFTSAPRGVVLDTPEQIKVQAQAIESVAVASKIMPLANLTRMTQAERDLLGAWIRQGARIE